MPKKLAAVCRLRPANGRYPKFQSRRWAIERFEIVAGFASDFDSSSSRTIELESLELTAELPDAAWAVPLAACGSSTASQAG